MRGNISVPDSSPCTKCVNSRILNQIELARQLDDPQHNGCICMIVGRRQVGTMKLRLSDKKGQDAGFLNCELNFSGPPIVEPHSIDGREAAKIDSREKAVVTETFLFTIVKAKELPHHDVGGKNDPYVKLQFDKKVLSSSVHFNRSDKLRFDETFELNFNADEIWPPLHLEMAVFHRC